MRRSPLKVLVCVLRTIARPDVEPRERFADELHLFANRAQAAVEELAAGDAAAARAIAQQLGVLVPAPEREVERRCLCDLLKHFAWSYCSRRGMYPVPEPDGIAPPGEEVTVWFVRSLWAPVPTRNARVTAVLREVQRGYARPELRLEPIAKAAALSVPYFRRLVRRWAGAEIAALVRWERVVRAQWHLSRSASDIKSVAQTLGYPWESQFDRDFKRECGVTPREFRALALRQP
jgi:AraC-like DNA-binding protein